MTSLDLNSVVSFFSSLTSPFVKGYKLSYSYDFSTYSKDPYSIWFSWRTNDWVMGQPIGGFLVSTESGALEVIDQDTQASLKPTNLFELVEFMQLRIGQR